MGRSFRKNVLRMIQTTKSRFFSLFAIVLIGVAFFVGVSSSSTMLAASVDAYNDEQNLKDFTIYSTYGFSEEDIEVLESLDEVDLVETSKFVDAVAGNEDFQVMARIHSYKESNLINAFVLKEGRLPENNHEILAEKSGDLSAYFSIGDSVTLQRNDGDLDTYLENDTYTVVGLIDSPLYLNQSRENSTLSNQPIETYFYVLDEAFCLEIDPELDILTVNGKSYNSFSDSYEQYIESVQEDIESVMKQRENSEYERILAEANDAYEEGLQEYRDGYKTYYQEINDAQKEIDDAQKEIDNGYATINTQIANLQTQTNTLNETESSTRQKLTDAKNQIDSGKQQLSDALTQLNSLLTSAQQLYDGQKELEDGIDQIALLQQYLSQLPEDEMLTSVIMDETIIASISEIDVGWKEHTVKELISVVSEMETEMETSLSQVNTNIAQIEVQVSSFSAEVAGNISSYDSKAKEIEEEILQESEIQNLLMQLMYVGSVEQYPQDLNEWIEKNEVDETSSFYEMLLYSMSLQDSLETELQKQKSEKQEFVLTSIQSQIDELHSTYQNLLEQESSYETSVVEFESQISSARQQISDGWSTINDAIKQLEEAQATLDENIANFEEEKTNGLQELEDARNELQDAKEEIESLEEGQWTLLSRKQHYSSVTFDATVDQMAAIGRIFPMFFLMVAILVCLTTMSRTISEQRGEIGVMRALGYTRFQCLMKYLIYAASATVFGELIGVVVGVFTFPIIIYETWRLMYNLPSIKIVVDPSLVILTCLVFLLVMLATTWFTANEDMKENSASLLRPKAPKLGKQILLERVTFLWKRLSFSWKITIRNLFRYKRRFIMTVLGIAGCSALLTTGFGIRDSITTMVSLQYDEIVHYDGYLTLSELTTDEELEEIGDIVGEHLMISGYQANAYDDGSENSVTVQIFNGNEDLDSYYTLRTRTNHAGIILDDSGVIIDEKLSELMGKTVGDTFELEGEDGEKYTVRIAAVMEYYLNHYCLMSNTYYESVTGMSPESKVVLIQNSDHEEEIKDCINLDFVESLSWFPDSLRSFDTMISSLNLIIWTIILSSMVLAFVVLGNLMNVNISERSREIATLKVLGFHQKEVQNYIYNENNVLTFLGALVGLPLGTWLHSTIMLTVEMDYVMFGRTVQPLSYFYALGLTILFGVIVNFFMRKYLKNIEMVESLKSVE